MGKIGNMLAVGIIAVVLVSFVVGKMWGKVWEKVGEGNEEMSVRRRRRVLREEFRRWLEEEEEKEFLDMLIEFDNVEDDTENDWTGWLLFREEFDDLLRLYVEEEEGEQQEDWDEEIRRGMYGDIGKFFKGG